jgi:hypothetical protein
MIATALLPPQTEQPSRISPGQQPGELVHADGLVPS